MENTRRTLERVPEGRMDWAPHEKSMTTGSLATHIANLPTWVGITIGQDRFVLTLPRAAVLRSFVMNHLIHHRAQLTVYLRRSGVAVPALYGPSADES